MSYESPIEIVYREMKNQLENDVCNLVQSYGIKVDKDELIKALEYDRNQYQQGYADAKAELERKKGEWIKEYWNGEHTRKCSVCNRTQTVTTYRGKVNFNFCPYCGADMRGINENA